MLLLVSFCGSVYSDPQPRWFYQHKMSGCSERNGHCWYWSCDITAGRERCCFSEKLWMVVQGFLAEILSRRGRLQNFSSGSGLSNQRPEYKLWCLPEVIYYFSICFFVYFLFFYYEWVGIYLENVFKWFFLRLARCNLVMLIFSLRPIVNWIITRKKTFVMLSIQ